MVADDPWFKQAYGRPIGRKEISKEIIHIQNSLLSEIQVKLCGATIAIALDGWTNSRHSKMINYLIIHNGRAIFWRSIPSRFGKSAPVMFYLTKKAVLEMERVLKVVVMSLVADNENANKSLFSLLEDWRPWLLLIGCVHGFACKVLLVSSSGGEAYPCSQCAWTSTCVERHFCGFHVGEAGLESC